MCFDLVCINSGAVVIVLAHCGEVIVLTLSGDHWEEFNLTTDHLVCPRDFECQHVCQTSLEVCFLWLPIAVKRSVCGR